MNSLELKEAMFQTRLEIFELMYQLRISSCEAEKKEINKKIKTLQRLHYWQIRQLMHLEEKN